MGGAIAEQLIYSLRCPASNSHSIVSFIVGQVNEEMCKNAAKTV